MRSSWASNVALLANYIARNIGANGLPEYAYLPVTGQRAVQGSPARLIHALAVLDEAGQALNVPAWSEAATRGVMHCMRKVVNTGGKPSLMMPGQAPSAMADCQVLAAAAATDLPETASASVDALAARVNGMVQPDGRVTDTPKGLGIASEHDFLPGAALLSLAQYAARKRRRVAAQEACRRSSNGTGAGFACSIRGGWWDGRRRLGPRSTR